MSYYWQDNQGNFWQSPIGDDRARGRCTGIPECCIDYFIAGEFLLTHATPDWGYRPCPECVRTNNRIEPRSCGELKDACTCGTWALRVRLELDEDECEHMPDAELTLRLEAALAEIEHLQNENRALQSALREHITAVDEVLDYAQTLQILTEVMPMAKNAPLAKIKFSSGFEVGQRVVFMREGVSVYGTVVGHNDDRTELEVSTDGTLHTLDWTSGVTRW